MRIHSGWAFPDSDEHMWREMKPDGSYQRSHFEKAMEFVTDFSCAIDGGAHVGLWSALMAKRFKRVFAVEPALDTYECLLLNMAHLDNVRVKNVALSHVKYMNAALTFDAKQAERGNTGGRYLDPDVDGTIVCEPIDSWKLESLGFLKLDVEGFEPHAISGATDTIGRCRPVIIWEDKFFHTRYGLPKHETRKRLASLGYEHKARVGHDEIWCAAHL